MYKISTEEVKIVCGGYYKMPCDYYKVDEDVLSSDECKVSHTFNSNGLKIGSSCPPGCVLRQNKLPSGDINVWCEPIHK